MRNRNLFKTFVATSLLLLFVIACGGSTPPDSKFSKVTRHIASVFMADLKTELVSALQDSAGVIGAIYVCAEKAPEISAFYSSMPGLSVRRASARNRNPKNAPNEYETKALETMAKRPAAAGDEYFEWTEDDGVKTFRYVKAIKVAAPCLNCHGDKERMSPELLASIAENYPDDNATGFKMGDLRGIFTISIEWPEGKAAMDSILTTL